MLSDVVPHSEGLLPEWREVSYPGRRLLARGVAGSGKTTAIAERFKWLVAQGLRPELIALVTPSAVSARAMRGRLEAELERPYERLFVVAPGELACRARRRHRRGARVGAGSGERLALLLERIDELTLSHHDFGGSANALLAGFVRRIDRLKAELVSAEDFWPLGRSVTRRREREFADVYRAHERLLEELEARDGGGLILDALRKVGASWRDGFEHLLIDDAQELDLASARFALASGAIARSRSPATRRRRCLGSAVRARSDSSLRGRPTRQVVRSSGRCRCPAGAGGRRGQCRG